MDYAFFNTWNSKHKIVVCVKNPDKTFESFLICLEISYRTIEGMLTMVSYDEDKERRRIYFQEKLPKIIQLSRDYPCPVLNKQFYLPYASAALDEAGIPISRLKEIMDTNEPNDSEWEIIIWALRIVNAVFASTNISNSELREEVLFTARDIALEKFDDVAAKRIFVLTMVTIDEITPFDQLKKELININFDLRKN